MEMLSFLGGDMSSVLLSFSLRMFAVAQASTSLMHHCIECSRSKTLSGWADICFFLP